MSDTVFKVGNPLMQKSEIKNWQLEMKQLFKRMSIDCPIVADGIYGVSTRSYMADLCTASGLSATKALEDGVTPELRRKLRPGGLTAAQEKTKKSAARTQFRADLRKRYAKNSIKVHKPAATILQDSWGYHPGVHDGVDVIVPADAPIFAMVKSKVVDVRSSGWWNLGAPSDSSLKAKGDGIIQLEVLETVGPFKKGDHIGYGHAEKAKVKVGQIVEAGKLIGHAGFANAWHIHLMYNTGDTSKGIGNLDPRPILDYAVKNG